jgi:hypothetical protein
MICATGRDQRDQSDQSDQSDQRFILRIDTAIAAAAPHASTHAAR